MAGPFGCDFVPDECSAKLIMACTNNATCSLADIGIGGIATLFSEYASESASLSITVPQTRLNVLDAALIAALGCAFAAEGIPMPSLPDAPNPDDYLEKFQECADRMTEQVAEAAKPLAGLESIFTVTYGPTGIPTRIEA